MQDLYITRHSNNTLGGYYQVHIDGMPKRIYSGYTKRQAIKLYRQQYNMQYKKLCIIEY